MACSPPLKWHGGKHYLARKIVALMPPHTHYVEPYAGGLAVLLAKDPEGVSEVANDLHRELTNFWRVLQDERSFTEFQRIVQAVPFSEVEWSERCQLWPACPRDVGVAAEFFVRCRQSFAGRMVNFAPLTRRRTRRGMNEQAAAWLSAVEGLPEAHARLKRVVVLNRPALEVIRQQDGEGTLFYLDPPYLHDTRCCEVYDHEMSDADHRELLDTVRQCKGKVLLSGYPSGLYDATLHDWNRHTFDMANHAAGGGEKRRMTEVLWTNF